MPDFEKLLIANRGEIAIRIMRAANEMGKKAVAIFAEEDKLGLHRFWVLLSFPQELGQLSYAPNADGGRRIACGPMNLPT